MPTPVESAHLVLELFKLRRDPVLREARAWFIGEFHPRTFEEFSAEVYGPRNAAYRMVVGYWDMAASLVTFGAIDAEMFRAGNGEIVATFAKVEPFLAKLRETSGIKDLAHHMETVVRAMPGSTERLARLKQQFQAAAEAKDDKKGKRAKRR
jgi:hypothetical protein